MERRIVVVHGTFPSVHFHDFQVCPDLKLFVEQQGQLSDSHAVAQRYRVQSDERRVIRFQYRTLHFRAAQRVGTVEDDELNIVFRRRFHRVRHCVNVRVKAGAHVLNVKQQDVDVFQHVRCRLPRFPVQTVHGKSSFFIDVKFHVFPSLGVSPHPVFRAVQGDEVHVRVVV